MIDLLQALFYVLTLDVPACFLGAAVVVLIIRLFV